MLINQSVASYVDVLASDAHAPGGGSASALVGVTGVSLIQMAIRLTNGKQDAEQEFLNHSLEKLEEKRQELIKIIDDDAIAFSKLMNAYQMPRKDGKEVSARTAAIQGAVIDTATIPLKAAKANVEALVLGEALYDYINPNLISDLKIGLMHCFTGVKGSIINVEVNLPLLKDIDQKNKLEIEAGNIKNQSQAIYHKIKNKLKEE